MDLQVYAIILIVFMVSFLSYLFISKFLPHGKTFDEMIAEKKKMREEVLGPAKSALREKSSNAGSKKKPKKEVKKRDSQQKIAREVTSNESDASESSEAVPATPPETVVLRKNAAKPQQQQPQQAAGKKGKGKIGTSTNKIEPVLAKETHVEELTNHFEEIQPKEVVEIHRAEPEKKHFREHKKSKPVKVETPPISPKNQTVKVAEEKPAKKKRNEPSTSAADSGVVHLVSDETGITLMIRELSRAELTKNQIQVLIDFLLNKQSDTIGHDPAEWTEGKADLVQRLKKQLQEKEAQLKNEQDALSGMQSKLKELRTEFNNERVSSNASLKAHIEHLQSSRMDNKNLQAEIQFLTEKHNNEKQAMSASFKQLQAQCVLMKDQLKAHEALPNIQDLQSENQTLQHDVAVKSQQIVELTSTVEDGRQKEEQLKQAENKIADYEIHLRKKDESYVIVENDMRQRVQDLENRDNEIQKLGAEVGRAKELDMTVQRQASEIDQLKKQLAEQNNRADESNKIEIRNLQNALDSSKKELESQRQLVSGFKSKIDELNKQLIESKQLTNSKASSADSFLLNEKMNELVANHQKQLAEYQKQVDTLQKAEKELTSQIDEQKAKNNDLRTKNWKLVEALQTAQSSTAMKSTNHSNFVTHPSGVVEVTKVKELLSKHFPEAPTSSNDADDTAWLESVLENLKMQLVSNKSSLSNTSSNTSPVANNNVTNNNHLNNYSDVEKTNNLNNSAVNGVSNSSTSSSTAENEAVLLQNSQLKLTVDEYKNIIAETESMLKNLESKVREQDAYWTKVVSMKDHEIENLKSISGKS